MKKKALIVPFAIISIAVLIMIYTETTTAAALKSLINAYEKIIPSIFPYMVISSMITSGGSAALLGRIFPVSRIISLPDCASVSMILGALCGFPLGAQSAVELYKSGYLSKEETEVLISTANNTGPTFIIYVIGVSLWKNKNFGIFLYIGQIITSFISSILINKLFFPVQKRFSNIKQPIVIHPFINSLTKAIKSASLSSITICGFVIFFSVLSNLFKKVFSFLPQQIICMFTAFLEFANGTSESVLIGGGTGAFICGFAIGWSGVSVFCQTYSFTSDFGLSLNRTVLVKFIQGILLGFSSLMYNSYAYKLSDATNFVKHNSECILLLSVTIISLLSLLYIYLVKKRKDA